MEYTDFSMDVSKLHYNSFVFQGDDNPVNRRTVFADDDTEYNVHTIDIISPVN